MKWVRSEPVKALRMVVLLTVCLGLLYPLAVLGVLQGTSPGNANGQQIHAGGRLVGSKLIGQAFVRTVERNGRPELRAGEPVTIADARYFQSRPSSTTPADDAAATAFANRGPNNLATERGTASNIAAYIALNGRYHPGGLSAAQVPADAAQTSASGIDPDISVANARIQAYRIATLRHLSLSQVDALVAAATHGRVLGFLGESGVNVLELNFALDRLRR